MLWSCLKQSWIKVAFACLVSVVPGVLMGSIRLSIYINTSMCCRLAFQARHKVNELSKQVFKQKRKEGLEER